MIEEKINANFEPLHATISALTEMMDRLIQESRPEGLRMRVPGNSDFNLNLPSRNQPEPLDSHRYCR